MSRVASTSTSSWRSARLRSATAIRRCRAPRSTRSRRAWWARCRRCWRKRWRPSSAAGCRGSSRSAFSRPAPRRWRPPCGWRASPRDGKRCWAAATTDGSTVVREATRRASRPAAARCTARSRSTTRRCTRERIRAVGSSLAAVVIEPVIHRPPDPEWLAVLREETARLDALLIVDEIKTVGRLAVGGAMRALRDQARPRRAWGRRSPTGSPSPRSAGAPT